MRRRFLLGSFAIAAALACAMTEATARADDAKIQCPDAYEQAQRLRLAHRYQDALKELATCRASCPAALVADCEGWTRAVEAARPVLHLEIRDAAGSPIDGARVFVDAEAIAASHETAQITVDPGLHVVQVERDGYLAASERVDVAEAPHDRAIAITLRPIEASQANATRAPSYVLAASGAALLIAAGALALKGESDRTHLIDTCAPFCAQSANDAVATKWRIAGGLAAGGAISVALAAFLWPRASASPVSGHLEIGNRYSGVAFDVELR